jgi:arylsulfatase A-like enzyme
MYNVFRLIKQMVDKRILRRKMVVTEFYQPADAINEVTLDWIDDNDVPQENPFFLFIHYMDPHDPFMDPESAEGGYARVRMEEPDPDLFLEPMRKAYIKEIEYLDQQLGLLFDELKSRGVYDESIIVLTADHGEEFYDHEGWWHGKTLYEELTHVPLMIKLPQNAMGGQTNTGIARHVDLAPTLLQYAGLEKGAMMTGQPLFTPANEFANAGIGYSFAENSFEGNLLQSVRSDSMKLIQANEDNPRGLAPLELYNLINDPGEQTNLAEDSSLDAEKAMLRKTIDDFLAICEGGAIEPAKPTEIGGEVREQLDSLGYLE